MESLREANVTIYKDTNKSTYKEVLRIGEFNEDETMEEFCERVNGRMLEIYLEKFN